MEQLETTQWIDRMVASYLVRQKLEVAKIWAYLTRSAVAHADKRQKSNTYSCGFAPITVI